jgi:colanic acid/amylovoran biosynthesis glycosyltransferase
MAQEPETSSVTMDLLKGNNFNLVYITGTYPLLTTTFIDREINMLRRWGVNLRIVSIRRPSSVLSKEQNDLQQNVIYLLPVSWVSFLWGHTRLAFLRMAIYFRTLIYLLSRPHPDVKSRLLTFLHFNEGVYAAHLLRDVPIDQIHAHFVDRAATVALVVSRLLDVPYSLTAHASDIYVNPLLLGEKLSGAKFAVTCTGQNKEYLSNLGENKFDHKLRCIYHGLDVGIYERKPIPSPGKQIILSVGQLKERKGFSFLLRASRILIDQGYIFECHIIGEGPLREKLEAEIRQLSLQDTVILCGGLPHQEVIKEYQQASIFALPAILAADGDRDGVPNVILEAMAMELPVVSTQHSGIPEVVEEGVNGLLVPPCDENALASALALLLDNPDYRERLGKGGRRTVIEKFDLERNTRQLFEEFISRNSSLNFVPKTQYH